MLSGVGRESGKAAPAAAISPAPPSCRRKASRACSLSLLLLPAPVTPAAPGAAAT